MAQIAEEERLSASTLIGIRYPFYHSDFVGATLSTIESVVGVIAGVLFTAVNMNTEQRTTRLVPIKSRRLEVIVFSRLREGERHNQSSSLRILSSVYCVIHHTMYGKNLRK